MSRFFSPNITRAGRVARAVWGLSLIVAGIFAWRWKAWVAVILFAAGAFALFEAARGWCVVRACGIKTKL